MGRSVLKTAILSSSRADFGIYLPLAVRLKEDKAFSLEFISFGTHPSKRYGFPQQQITDAGFNISYSFDTAPEGDSPGDITRSMALVTKLMADVWEKNQYDIVFALGDRYEMFAAVASAMPFNIKIAHIHGGETTLGAIDNAFRHSITHMSHWHFACAEPYKQRIIELTGNPERVYNTGALGIESLSKMDFPDTEKLKLITGIDFSAPTLLITLHPETIGADQNEQNTAQMLQALDQLVDFQQVITMPNADTSGLMMRRMLIEYGYNHSNVKIVENLGSSGYLAAMKYAALMLGNSSSGFMEASFFPKWVINLGHRQDGRIRTRNIIDVAFKSEDIIQAVLNAQATTIPEFAPVYGDGHASEKIINILKNDFAIN